MIKRQRHSEEFKKKIWLELASGASSAGEISKRVGITSPMLYKWRNQVQTVFTTTDNKEIYACYNRFTT